MKPRIVDTTPPRILYPEHGTGRSAKLATCRHCGASPLILRKCARTRTCAVCQHCGFHHRVTTTNK